MVGKANYLRVHNSHASKTSRVYGNNAQMEYLRLFYSLAKTIVFVFLFCYMAITIVWILWFCLASSQFDFIKIGRSRALVANVSHALHVPSETPSSLPWIFMITPTHYYLEQKADLTRLSQTLQLVPNLHWLVVEDAINKSPIVEGVLKRSGLIYSHLNVPKDPKFKARGSPQRNLGLKWLRDHYKNKTKPERPSGVVYFGDDDNTYDLRLFKLMRTIKRIGIWPVGLVGGVMVETPKLDSAGRVASWDVSFNRGRKFATDMAGFAINLDLVLNTSAAFKSSGVNWGEQETSFLSQFGLKKEDLEPIGVPVPKPKKSANDTKIAEKVELPQIDLPMTNGKPEILVWHTKTKSSGGKSTVNKGFEV